MPIIPLFLGPPLPPIPPVIPPIFERRDKEQYTDSLSAYLPGGELFAARFDNKSNLYKLMRGLACELFNANGFLIEYDILPDKTEKFLDEWESTVGIPDDCFDGLGDLNTRRRDILVKLASSGIQTDQDFIDLALVFGKEVTVESAAENAFPPYDVPFTPVSLPEARFLIIIQGVNLISGVPPYDVPFTPGKGESLLECIFNKLKPANCSILFRNSN